MAFFTSKATNDHVPKPYLVTAEKILEQYLVKDILCQLSKINVPAITQIPRSYKM